MLFGSLVKGKFCKDEPRKETPAAYFYPVRGFAPSVQGLLPPYKERECWASADTCQPQPGLRGSGSLLTPHPDSTAWKPLFPSPSWSRHHLLFCSLLHLLPFYFFLPFCLLFPSSSYLSSFPPSSAPPFSSPILNLPTFPFLFSLLDSLSLTGTQGRCPLNGWHQARTSPSHPSYHN